RCGNFGGRTERATRYDRGGDRALSHSTGADRPHGAWAVPQRPGLDASGPYAAAERAGRLVRLQMKSDPQRAGDADPYLVQFGSSRFHAESLLPRSIRVGIDDLSDYE